MSIKKEKAMPQYPLAVGSEKELLSIAATIRSRKRAKYSGGRNGGRPKSLQYCDCGQYPVKNKPVKHKCEEEVNCER